MSPHLTEKTALSPQAFAQIVDSHVILSTRGTYSQADLHEWNDILFAKTKNGFIRLLQCESTTVKGVTWKSIHGTKFHETHMGPKLGAPEKVATPTPKKPKTVSRKKLATT